jgi:dTMP kinase
MLIAFEGIDGSGKTTQAALLARWASALGLEVVQTKEPTAGPWGMKVRNSKVQGRLGPEEELDCFINDRKEHVAGLIHPALRRGAMVIVDRYYYSTVAYQGARGMEPGRLLSLNREFAPVPQLVVLLDLEPAVSLERIGSRGLGQDSFESLEALGKSRAIFLGLGEPHVVRFDASLAVERLHQLIVAEVSARPPLAGTGLVAPKT